MIDDQNSDSGISYRQMSMNSAELKAFLASDMSRLKDDIGDIYDKLNDLKDCVNDNHLAVISQVTDEFKNIQNRFNDISLGMQRLQMDSEHEGRNIESKFKEFENRIAEITKSLDDLSASVHDGVSQSDINQIQLQFKSFRQSMNAAVAQLRTSVDALGKKESKTSDKVAKMSWRLGLIISAIAWLAATYGKDAVTSVFNAAVGTKSPTSTTNVVPQDDKR